MLYYLILLSLHTAAFIAAFALGSKAVKARGLLVMIVALSCASAWYQVLMLLIKK